MAVKTRWGFLHRRKERKPEDIRSEAGDLPRVVTTNAIGHLPYMGGGTRLGVGGGSGIRGGDLTDLILPVLLIGGALMFTDRACRWHSGSIGDYVPAPAAPLSSGPGGSSSGSAASTRRTAPAPTALSATPAAPAEQSGPTVNVVLEVEINAGGTVTAARIVRGAGGTADQRSIERVKSMRFEPARRGGAPIATRMEITVSVPMS